MKHIKLLISTAVAAILIVSLCLIVYAAEAPVWRGVSTRSAAEVTAKELNGTLTLFLPSDLSVDAVPLWYDTNAAMISVRGSKGAQGVSNGTVLDLTALCGEDYTLTLIAKSGGETAELTLKIVPTDGIASVHLLSDDPQEHGRLWVEASPDKSNKATGRMVMTNAAGEIVYQGGLTQIKGRGNSTWQAEKKPYQIKLSDKADLLETGEKANLSKTWVLLTNANDASGLRNSLAYDLSYAMGLGVESRPVNLFYDGEYRGTYLLCEKVEVNDGRVEIVDLEKATEKANDGTALEELPVKTATTANGATYTYCEGVKNPENITGGYLLEMEAPHRAVAEVSYFRTARGNYVVVKSPEFCSREQMDYIATWYQEYEDTIYNGGIHPDNGKRLEDYADLNALADCYLINELSKNADSYRTSSYLFKDADTNISVMGPVWDYDLSFGLGWGVMVDACAEPTNFFALRTEFCTQLYNYGPFRQAVHDRFEEGLYPLTQELLAEQSDRLTTIEEYRSQLRNASRANALLWGMRDWNHAVNQLKNYISIRSQWLKENLSTWNAETAEDLLGYGDVKPGDWYYDAVQSATRYGLMNGVGYGVFLPNGKATRAQATKVLFAASGDTAPDYQAIFPDVNEHDWFAPAVLWAKEKGIVGGYTSGRFGPNDNITRQDLVVILYRSLGSPAVSGKQSDNFRDSADVAHYAKDAVEWAIENSIMLGYEDSTLRPLNTVSRAELAALMVRYCESYIF